MSPPQEFAAELLLIGGEREKVEDLTERLKLSLISHDPARFIPMVFPDWVAGVDEQEPPEEVSGSADPFDPGETVFTQDMTQEEAEAMLEEVMNNPEGSMGPSQGWM